MAELLVSVRSAAEAATALAAGAALIDVKEPDHGSLGRAQDGTIAAVVQLVGGRRPVSAALGELLDSPEPFAGTGLAYVKWGLAGCTRLPDWQRYLTRAIDRVEHKGPPCRGVAVAYADWLRADSPPPRVVCAFARAQRCRAFLLDTWRKDGKTLLDWLPVLEVDRLCRLCRASGIRVALAGSLGLEQIKTLLAANPDWFAVRGAVCKGGRRGKAIDPDQVSRLVSLLTDSSRVAKHES
jgi:hypothetical protein